jgi:hypothetical protein
MTAARSPRNPEHAEPVDDLIVAAWGRLFVAYAIGAIDIDTCRAIERALFGLPLCPANHLEVFLNRLKGLTVIQGKIGSLRILLGATR